MSDTHPEMKVRLRRTEGYRFEVTYGDAAGTTIQLDEPAPHGEGQGPNASAVRRPRASRSRPR
jgi:hypothetical protein